MGASYRTVDCILKFAITEFVNSLSVNVTWTNIENMIVVVVVPLLYTQATVTPSSSCYEVAVHLGH